MSPEPGRRGPLGRAGSGRGTAASAAVPVVAVARWRSTSSAGTELEGRAERGVRLRSLCTEGEPNVGAGAGRAAGFGAAASGGGAGGDGRPAVVRGARGRVVEGGAPRAPGGDGLGTARWAALRDRPDRRRAQGRSLRKSRSALSAGEPNVGAGGAGRPAVARGARGRVVEGGAPRAPGGDGLRGGPFGAAVGPDRVGCEAARRVAGAPREALSRTVWRGLPGPRTRVRRAPHRSARRAVPCRGRRRPDPG